MTASDITLILQRSQRRHRRRFGYKRQELEWAINAARHHDFHTCRFVVDRLLSMFRQADEKEVYLPLMDANDALKGHQPRVA